MQRILLTFTLFVTALLIGCQRVPSADEIQNEKQEQMTMQAVNSVGMPAIKNFARKKTLKNIIELNDTTISTTTYLYDMQGHLHKLCDSIGYPMPAATQYTNPQQISYSSSKGYAITPQADPDGTYSPSSSEATWVTCLNPETKKLDTIYSEPRVIASPFPLKALD